MKFGVKFPWSLLDEPYDTKVHQFLIKAPITIPMLITPENARLRKFYFLFHRNRK